MFGLKKILLFLVYKWILHFKLILMSKSVSDIIKILVAYFVPYNLVLEVDLVKKEREKKFIIRISSFY